MEVMDIIFKEHGRVNSSAGWNGSPNPSDPRNIRRVCQCNEVIDWHDRSISRYPQPMSGYPFDVPHQAHIREILEELGYE